MFKKLKGFFPVSRRKYIEGLKEITTTLEATTTVIEGLVEAEANHSQIEMSIIQQLQKDKMEKPPSAKEKNNHDPAFM